MQKDNPQSATTGCISRVMHVENAQVASLQDIYKHLNFKVSPEFHREFKTFAASHDISMTALLIEGFNTLRDSQS